MSDTLLLGWPAENGHNSIFISRRNDGIEICYSSHGFEISFVIPVIQSNLHFLEQGYSEHSMVLICQPMAIGM